MRELDALWDVTATKRVTDAENTRVDVAGSLGPLCRRDLKYPRVKGCQGDSSSPSGPVRQNGPKHLSDQLGGGEGEGRQKPGRDDAPHRAPQDPSFLSPCGWHRSRGGHKGDGGSALRRLPIQKQPLE